MRKHNVFALSSFSRQRIAITQQIFNNLSNLLQTIIESYQIYSKINC